MYNVNTCPIGFSLPVSSNITTNVYTLYMYINNYACIYMYIIYANVQMYTYIVHVYTRVYKMDRRKSM